MDQAFLDRIKRLQQIDITGCAEEELLVSPRAPTEYLQKLINYTIMLNYWMRVSIYWYQSAVWSYKSKPHCNTFLA